MNLIPDTRNILVNHKLYLHMKRFLFISFLSLIQLSLFSQKVTVQVIRKGNADFSGWRIMNEQYKTVFAGDEKMCNDSVSFTLEANRHFFLKISVPEPYNTDTTLFSLLINGEPILLVNSEIGPGDHLLPFFTGMRSRDIKITGGTDALISDFPWQVYYESANYLCGASIIGDNWVVTAAHCTENDNGSAISVSDMTIKVGATDPSNEPDGWKYSISEVIIHEGYNNQTLENDIALLKVNGPINYPNAVSIKLVNADDVAEGVIIPGVMSWVTGWGLTKVSPDVFPSNLQKVQLPIVSTAQAATVWGSIPNTDLMAGYLLGNKDACNGDSGGPLVVPVFGEYKLAGIVSWGSSECNNYGAYTRVSDFVTWITGKTGIVKDYKPPTPAGETTVCQGELNSQYSIGILPAASAYKWELLPGNAGTVTGNSENATVLWNTDYIGIAEVILRVTIDNKVSDWSKLNVNIVQNTKLTSQSKDTTICSGQPIILSVTAEGYQLNYKWSKNGQIIQSGSSGQLNIANTSVDNSGIYSCDIADYCKTVFSNPINLTVLPLTDISSISPDTEVPFGNNVTLEVNAEGHNLIYQWQKNAVNIANSDTSKLYLPNVNATDIGLYQTIVKGTCGTENSDLVYLYVRKDINSAASEVFVWPTITSNEFNVALSNDGRYNVQILNSMGQLFREQTNCRYQTTFNISAMPRGVYIINIFNGNFRKSVRVIKE